jgi:plasmid stabilization system protein ParE
MPRGDKSKYTDKQKRQAEHIEEGYENRGTSKGEAERRAWATVNKMTHGGRKTGGSGQGTKTNKQPAKKGGRLGGAAAAARPATERSASARKAARTRASRSGRK